MTLSTSPTKSAMSTLEDRIRSTSAQNAALLQQLAATDHAHPALEQQDSLLKDLDRELNGVKQRLSKLEKKRKSELADHVRYRDSVMKRFAYKATGQKEKFAARAEKEEREYFEALQEEHSARESRAALENSIDEAKRVRSELLALASEHDQAQKSLDQLYSSLFLGPTPSFPAEDAKEGAVTRVQEELRQETLVKNAVDQAVDTLHAAKNQMAVALRQMDDALDASTQDMWGFGGSMADMMERSSLGSAQMAANEVNRLVFQAMRLDPAVRPLPPMNVAQGNLMSDVFFDNIFSDMEFHEKIKQSRAGIGQAALALNRELSDAQNRQGEHKAMYTHKLRELNDARRELQKAREAVYESLGAGNAAPPPYQP